MMLYLIIDLNKKLITMKTKQLTHEQESAKLIGFIINVVLTIAGASFCIYGVYLFAVKNHLFNF